MNHYRENVVQKIPAVLCSILLTLLSHLNTCWHRNVPCHEHLFTGVSLTHTNIHNSKCFWKNYFWKNVSEKKNLKLFLKILFLKNIFEKKIWKNYFWKIFQQQVPAFLAANSLLTGVRWFKDLFFCFFTPILQHQPKLVSVRIVWRQLLSMNGAANHSRLKNLTFIQIKNNAALFLPPASHKEPACWFAFLLQRHHHTQYDSRIIVTIQVQNPKSKELGVTLFCYATTTDPTSYLDDRPILDKVPDVQFS